MIGIKIRNHISWLSLVYIHHTVLYVPGKSFMVRFLEVSAFGNEVFYVKM